MTTATRTDSSGPTSSDRSGRTDRTDRSTDLALFLVAFVWGSSYLAAKSAAAATSVLAVLLARYALSAISGSALLAARGQLRPTRAELRTGTTLGLTQASVLIIETYGVAHTSAANAGLIISLTIILTPLLDRRGGALPARYFAAAGVCVVAVGLLMSGSGGLHAPSAGDLLMLAAAVVRAGHVTLVGRLTSGGDIRPLSLTVIQTYVGTALFALPAAAELPKLAHAGASAWAEMVYLAVFCSVFAFVAQTWAVRRTSASRASLLLGTEPIWAVAAGVALGGEHLAAPAVVGAALMLAGTYWGQAIERAHRTRRLAALPELTPA
ncbi:DMT family transporter [Catenulispora sp. NL8]|uniref:DMT family transporter n=1 Tax=Catenulispora pinistramenti TaxID=2705254 RepID=A0ABS5L8P3_9ACTN|nr:DMT family transporter [Catenulispora pinistramenti]MBS2554590.1 DMT family transporter [Catenulispora pinistramenti]